MIEWLFLVTTKRYKTFEIVGLIFKCDGSSDQLSAGSYKRTEVLIVWASELYSLTILEYDSSFAFVNDLKIKVMDYYW